MFARSTIVGSIISAPGYHSTPASRLADGTKSRGIVLCVMTRHRIPARQGLSFELSAGESFEIVDPEGAQVADLVAFRADDHAERFSPKYTYRREGTLRPSTGNRLYTTEGNAILRIVDDDCGVHDLLYGPCNHWILEEYYGQDGIGCRGNLSEVLGPEGIRTSDLQETMNVFMKSAIEGDRVEIVEPDSEPGDSIGLEAEMDALVGVTACSGEAVVNAGEAKPIDVRLPDGALLRTTFE